MNKKGFISISFIFIMILVVIVLAMAQNKVDTSTINQTIDTLNWTKIGHNVTESLRIAAESSTNTIVQTIINIVYKAVDFFGYAIFEVGKLAMQLARDNPDIINYKVLLVFIALFLLAPLIYPAFIIIVSLFLIVKEWIITRREKKELTKLTEVYK